MSEFEYSWINAKRPDKFFRSYAVWCEEIRKNGITSDQISSAYEQLANSSKMGRNSTVVRYKLLIEALKLDNGLLVDEYYQFLDELKNSGFWIEKSLTDSPGSNENSFLAAQGFSYKLDEGADLIKKVNSRASIDRARKNLSRIFNRIDELSNGTTDFSEALKSIYQPQPQFFSNDDRLSALAAIHFEITDNIDHWMSYPENPRYTEESDALLGDTLVFEVRFRYIPNSPQTGILNSLESYFSDSPAEYIEFARSTIEARESQGVRAAQLKKRGFRFFELNYYDNGRGIEQNFSNFSSDGTYSGLADTISEHKSTRKFAKAGLGYSKVIEWSEQEEGLFFIHSGNEIVSNLKHRDKPFASRKSEDYYPGTQCSILIAV